MLIKAPEEVDDDVQFLRQVSQCWVHVGHSSAPSSPAFATPVEVQRRHQLDQARLSALELLAQLREERDKESLERLREMEVLEQQRMASESASARELDRQVQTRISALSKQLDAHRAQQRALQESYRLQQEGLRQQEQEQQRQKLLLEEQRRAEQQRIEQQRVEQQRAEQQEARERAKAAAQDSVLESINAELQTLAQDTASKNQRMVYKMQIHKRVGQISKSLRQIRSITAELCNLLNSARASSPQLYLFCLVTLGEKIAEQGEKQVSANSGSSYDIALVCKMLMDLHERLAEIVLAKLIQKCPYCKPRPDIKQSEYIVAGETEEAFFNRMCGVIAVYAALTQTEGNRRHGIDNGWKWLAKVLNSPPQKITPSILATFLEICGFALWQQYGVQFRKLLLFIHQDYLGRMSSDVIAARTRLEILVRNSLAGGGVLVEPEARKLQ